MNASTFKPLNVVLRIVCAAAFSLLLLLGLGAPAHASHESCGNGHNSNGTCLNNCTGDGYSQSSYYRQSSYYQQTSYYQQSSYYQQASYYLQGGYWPDVDEVVLTVSPSLIRSGESTTLTWDGGNASSCTLTGGGLNISSVSGSQVLSNITGETVMSIVCTLGPNQSSASTTIKVIPSSTEAMRDFIHRLGYSLQRTISGLL